MNLETKIKTLEEAKSKLVEAEHSCFEAGKLLNLVDVLSQRTLFYHIRMLIEEEQKLIDHEIKRLRIKGE